MKVLRSDEVDGSGNFKWAFAFTNDPEDVDGMLDLPVFGMTSHAGVFTPWGFERGTFLLASHESDGVEAFPYMVEGGVKAVEEGLKEVAGEIFSRMGRPDMLMMFPTLGLEEVAVRTLDESFEGRVRIFGATAGDEDLSGGWLVFANGKKTSSGVVVVALKSRKGKILSDFHAGYILTGNRGTVTKCLNLENGSTVIYEIDGKPASEVFARWLKGQIDHILREGGNIPFEVAGLNPLARKFGDGIVLSNVFEILADEGAILVLSSIKEGEVVYHATATPSFLTSRVVVAVKNSLQDNLDGQRITGAVFTYCAGCIAPIAGNLDRLSKLFRKMLPGVPFLGVASFGEQGSLRVSGRIRNFHANQMIATVIFTTKDAEG